MFAFALGHYICGLRQNACVGTRYFTLSPGKGMEYHQCQSVLLEVTMFFITFHFLLALSIVILLPAMSRAQSIMQVMFVRGEQTQTTMVTLGERPRS